MVLGGAAAAAESASYFILIKCKQNTEQQLKAIMIRAGILKATATILVVGPHLPAES